MSKNPFIKVVWEDTPENITEERIRRIKKYFEKKYDSTSVRVIPKLVLNHSDVKLQSLGTSDNILDLQYQKRLVKDFLNENELSDYWDMINRLDDKVNSKIVNSDKIKYSKWYIKKIEFSNILSFGDDNIIDFNNVNGITVVESDPPNFGGKTTATVDLLLFLFFGITTKSKTLIEIFNRFTDKNEVYVTGYITIDDENYVINRVITRKRKREGDDYSVKSELNFHKILDNGEVFNLNDEQRRETEKIIKSAIGTEEDFLSTILTTGNNLEELIESKPTARGQILTKFLGLDNLKEKEDICKEMYNEWSKGLLSNTNNITDLTQKNSELEQNIANFNIEIDNLTIKLTETEQNLKLIEDKKEKLLRSRNNDINENLMQINPILLEQEINNLESEKNKLKLNYEQINVKEPSSYYVEEEHINLNNKIREMLISLGIEKNNIQMKKILIKQFIEGAICPTCNRKLDDADHTDEINSLNEDVEKLEKVVLDNEKLINELKKTEADLSTLKNEFFEYESNKLKKIKAEMEIEKKQSEIEARKTKIEYFNSNKKKMEENLKIETELVGVKTQIETANADIKYFTINIEKNKGNIVTANQNISTNNEIIKKIKIEEQYLPIFKTYLSIFGKNGISKIIMKNVIPLLNEELSRILSDTTHFTLELNINERNEVEFFMIDNESRVVKSLSSGSGYEKTISSLAIRSVLTKISSLPKPNVVVMDEVFGKIADENLELVGEFFIKIKDYFEHIFVISHNPLIRNWSDSIMTIKKENNISYIEEVITRN